MKTLVVYYSRKGYTQRLALDWAKENGADFLEIEPIDNTVGYSGFENCLGAGITKRRMTLMPYDTQVADYDKVVLFTPIWLFGIASPMREFAWRERHNIRRAEYVFVHMLPFNYDSAAAELDKILRLTREDCTFIRCFWGKIYTDPQETTDD